MLKLSQRAAARSVRRDYCDRLMGVVRLPRRPHGEPPSDGVEMQRVTPRCV